MLSLKCVTSLCMFTTSVSIRDILMHILLLTLILVTVLCVQVCEHVCVVHSLTTNVTYSMFPVCSSCQLIILYVTCITVDSSTSYLTNRNTSYRPSHRFQYLLADRCHSDCSHSQSVRVWVRAVPRGDRDTST